MSELKTQMLGGREAAKKAEVSRNDFFTHPALPSRAYRTSGIREALERETGPGLLPIQRSVLISGAYGGHGESSTGHSMLHPSSGLR